VAKPPKTPPPATGEDIQIPLKTETGTDFAHLQRELLSQTLSALWLPGDLSKEEQLIRIKAAGDALREIGPQDGLEGMLAVQMVAMHHAALECFRQATLPNQTPESFDMNLRHAQKLTAGYLRHVEALDKRRGKGQQTVVVKYVNVESGGQAVVGTVHTGYLPSPSVTNVDTSMKAVTQQVVEPLAISQQPAVVRSRRKGGTG
jgi:hypothetical protein